MPTVRTRIAPSPTGDPHVGTAYIALFNLCFARQHGGQFVLRIEDTDQLRSTPESERKIFESLRWLGLSWDEGPDIGGPFGPYRQSERAAIYQHHVQELLGRGHAFHCFCSPERLDALRKEQMSLGQNPCYDGHCLHLSQNDVAERLASAAPCVIRMKVPDEGICTIEDLLRGTIEIPWSQVDMQVLMKADGLPTYHLANVVDDHLMQITHVIRGEEWISSAPKHQLLYAYFGWNMPTLCHMPLLRNPDRSKLSKRKNPTSILFYRSMGYLPAALLNYLGRMGWSMPDEREQFGLDEMIKDFDISRISLGGPIFDVEKLDWLNALWLRSLNPEGLLRAFMDWKFNRSFVDQVLAQCLPRIHRLSDVVPWVGFFFEGLPEITAEKFVFKKVDAAQSRDILHALLWASEQAVAWNSASVEAMCVNTAGQLGLKLRDFMGPVFVAISGSSSSTPVMEAMAILGADLVRARLRHAIQLLGALSREEESALQQRLRS